MSGTNFINAFPVREVQRDMQQEFERSGIKERNDRIVGTPYCTISISEDIKERDSSCRSDFNKTGADNQYEKHTEADDYADTVFSEITYTHEPDTETALSSPFTDRCLIGREADRNVLTDILYLPSEIRLSREPSVPAQGTVFDASVLRQLFACFKCSRSVLPAICGNITASENLLRNIAEAIGLEFVKCNIRDFGKTGFSSACLSAVEILCKEDAADTKAVEFLISAPVRKRGLIAVLCAEPAILSDVPSLSNMVFIIKKPAGSTEVAESLCNICPNIIRTEANALADFYETLYDSNALHKVERDVSPDRKDLSLCFDYELLIRCCMLRSKGYADSMEEVLDGVFASSLPPYLRFAVLELYRRKERKASAAVCNSVI